MTIIVIISRPQENAKPFVKRTKVIFKPELREIKGPQNHEDSIKRLTSNTLMFATNQIELGRQSVDVDFGSPVFSTLKELLS